MKKKYIPKYNPTRNESLDSDEVHHLFNNIMKHESNRQLRNDILFVAIPTALLIVLALWRLG